MPLPHRRRFFPTALLAAAVVALLPALATVAFAEAPADYSIVPVGGNLYQARDGGNVTLFLVSADGIVLLDPLDLSFAGWLREEMATRFPGRQVRTLVYTRADFRRIGGGGAFGDVKRIIASDGLRDTLKRQRASLPPPLAPLDHDRDGVLDRGELESIDAHTILQRDHSGDGRVDASEAWSIVWTPTSTYTKRHTLHDGDSAVELIQPGSAYGEDVTIVYFPRERVVFANPYPSAAQSLDPALSRPAQLPVWMKVVESLDFDRLIGADGVVLRRADLTGRGDYAARLVATAAEAGPSGNTGKKVLVTSSPAGSSDVDRADLVRVRETSRVQRIDAYGAAVFVHVGTNADDLCGPSPTSCDLGSSVRVGAVGGAGTSVGRWRAAFEATSRQRSRVTAGGTFQTDRRDVLLTPMLGFEIHRRAALAVTVSGGPTFDRVATETWYSSQGTLARARWRHGVTYGADLSTPLGRHAHVLVPLRMTHLRVPSATYGVTSHEFRAGIGVAFDVMTRLR